MAHRVERVGDDDQDRVGRLRDASRSPSATIFSFVVTRSSRLIPGSRGTPAVIDDDGRAGRLLVAVRADDVRLVAEHRAHLVDVERLPLRQALLDVDEHDVGVVAASRAPARTCADVAGADDGDLRLLIRAAPSFSISASATSLVPTAVGSSRRRLHVVRDALALADQLGDRLLEPVGRLVLARGGGASASPTAAARSG